MEQVHLPSLRKWHLHNDRPFDTWILQADDICSKCELCSEYLRALPCWSSRLQFCSPNLQWHRWEPLSRLESLQWLDLYWVCNGFSSSNGLFDLLVVVCKREASPAVYQEVCASTCTRVHWRGKWCPVSSQSWLCRWLWSKRPNFK